LSGVAAPKSGDFGYIRTKSGDFGSVGGLREDGAHHANYCQSRESSEGFAMFGLRFSLILCVSLRLVSHSPAESLPETKPLTREGDLAAQMVAGIDHYLMRELAASVEQRTAYWKPDYSSVEAYQKSVQPNRERLKKILGIVDERVPPRLHYVGGPGEPALIGESSDFKVYTVCWAVLPGVDAEGLLFEPDSEPSANIIVIPDADWTPEMVAGLTPGVPLSVQTPFGLARLGMRVLVPTLINRKDDYSGNPKLGRLTNQPHREFIYRMAYEMGRHILGYEIQKVLAGVDWMQANSKPEAAELVGLIGYGEGGFIARLAAAVDQRIKYVAPLGHGGPAEAMWGEPIYRNIWGYLREFGTAELYRLTIPRFITAEPQTVTRGGVAQVDVDLGWPVLDGPPPARAGRSGAAPGRLTVPTVQAVEGEWKRAWDTAVTHLRNADSAGYKLALLLPLRNDARVKYDKVQPKTFDQAARQKRQFEQLVAYTQKLMRDSERGRQEGFWAKLDLSSPAKYQASTASLRKQMWEELIGKLPKSTEPMNARSRLAYDEPKWKGYEITLDLYPDVFAYGILLVPKDLKPGEKRPVVVCQHGLEGRPQDVVNPKVKTRAYNSFGAQLADRGYIIYAPQNPYIGHDRFRVLQRKANPLGLSLYSFIVRQHERTLDWLARLPFVDADRIAFYGLSYGGKTAMRVPALLPRYCLSICSGDFNEWVWKNVSVDFPASYLFSGEYEMYEFNLGNTFNYAEMAALIAPRPFMVERGHDDGVGIDEWVAYEYAKVRRLYSKLGLPERTEIEFFPGGHMINGKGTFAFLARHLKWPN
jgi:dienelactone hydrolase